MRPELMIDNQICFSLYRLSKFITQRYQPHLTALEITYPQFLVFLVLWENGSMNVKLLGEHLALDSGTLSPLLKRLEEKKYLVRKKSLKDERSVIVELTAKGKKLYEKAEGIPDKMVCQIPCCLDELGKLKTDLDKLYKAWTANCSKG